VNVLASRISYVGELGWELYVSFEQGAKLWDMVWEAGQKFGIVPVGIGVYGTTGRLEKAYRLYGSDLEMEFNLVEAGMTRPKVKSEAFIGKAAYLKQRETPPAALLCSMTMDDNTSASGVKRFPQGREPILTLDGNVITDAHGRNAYVTSAGAGPSLGKYILMAYLPPEYAKVGTQLKVEYFGEHYPITVASVGATPLLDPENKRLKA
jgi:glycine cleavage system aminomethyltransferase T